jgi:3-dehydrosphinganine reductase
MKTLHIIVGSLTTLLGALFFIAKKYFSPKYDYSKKHVLITGGRYDINIHIITTSMFVLLIKFLYLSSSGIGFELAKEYIRQGANVSIVARSKAKLEKAVKEIQPLCRNNQKILSASVDTSASLQTVVDAFQELIGELGDVDVLVNCAGTSIAGEFQSTDPQEFSNMFNTNVMGSVYPTRAVINSMTQRGSGRIVFVSSQVAQAAIHGYTAYGASKWALRGFAEALQMEVKPYNIYVSVCYPPDTDTPGYELEMKSKPLITKKLSESGSVYSPHSVALDIVRLSACGYFGISTGLDGWMLKQVHPGMSPVNHWAEVIQPLIFAPMARIISIFVVLSWDSMVAKLVNFQPAANSIQKEKGNKSKLS